MTNQKLLYRSARVPSGRTAAALNLTPRALGWDRIHFAVRHLAARAAWTGLSRDDRDRLTDKPHLISGDNRLHKALESLDRREPDGDGRDLAIDVSRSDDGENARQFHGRADIDGADSPVRDRRTQNRGVQQSLAREIGNELSAPSQESLILDSVDGLADIGVRLYRHCDR